MQRKRISRLILGRHGVDTNKEPFLLETFLSETRIADETRRDEDDASQEIKKCWVVPSRCLAGGRSGAEWKGNGKQGGRRMKRTEGGDRTRKRIADGHRLLADCTVPPNFTRVVGRLMDEKTSLVPSPYHRALSLRVPRRFFFSIISQRNYNETDRGARAHPLGRGR